MASAALASCGRSSPEVAGDVADQGRAGLVGGGAQRVGVAEPPGLRVQLVVLAGLRGHASISSSPCRRTSAACASSRAWPAAALEVAGQLPPAGVGLAVAVQQLQVRGPGVAVQGAALLGRAGQPQLVALPVHGQQPLGQLGDDARRARCARRGGRASGPRR
jgi:hypothetical protein